mmetsp:Transcript_635/g.1110  ORF Transcript_635/g.1110 Transcript_635/m.1110 type:complete len:99 (+) Transcript_635:1292-1588(+)
MVAKNLCFNEKVSTIRPVYRWAQIENYIFFNAIREFGLNFSIIDHLLVHKSYKQISSKFKKENIKVPHIIKKILKLRKNQSMRNKLLNLVKFNNALYL